MLTWLIPDHRETQSCYEGRQCHRFLPLRHHRVSRIAWVSWRHQLLMVCRSLLPYTPGWSCLWGKVSKPLTIIFGQRKKDGLTLANKTKNLRWREDNVTLNLHVLHHFSIDSCSQPCTIAIPINRRIDKHGTNRSEFVECLCVEKLSAILFGHLEYSTTEVIAYGVA